MGFVSIAGYGLVILLIYNTVTFIYNAFFHPLARFKGPLWWRGSRIPFVSSMVRGRLPHRVAEIHKEYGEIVRIAPNELSCIEPAAWKDIYTKPELIRPWIWRGKPPGQGGDNLISAGEKDHARFRKVLGPGFSEGAVRKQETIITGYIHTLMQRLREKAAQPLGKGSAVVDMVEWFNYTTFDIIGDLGWGSSFDCLQSQKLSGWIQVVLHFKAVVLAVSFKYFPPLDTILEAITPKSALAGILDVVETSKQKVAERLSKKSDRPDVMGHILSTTESSSDLHMTKEEMDANSMALIIAGSESVTTILAGTVNNLLTNPTALQKLVKEIRTSFRSEDEINGTSTNSLPYLNAVIQEGMRSTPSFPDGSRRDVPSGGTTVAGEFIPAGTTIMIPQWSAYTSSVNFTNPLSFSPERWLAAGSTTFAKDRKAIFQPFGYGAHNCLGQPLAWFEMRVILARLVWNFDLEVPEGSVPLKWSDQEIYWVWVKQPVQVKITPR